MGQHVFQHSDSPTWCVNCGRFDVFCTNECSEPETRKFDSAVQANFDRMYEDFFGTGISAEV